MKRYIYGMSGNLSDVRNQLRDAGEQIALHLIKLAIYPDAQQCNHWEQEIYAFLHKVPKLKKNNKYPDARFIFDALSVYDDVIDNLVLEVYDDEEDLPVPSEVDIAHLERVIVDYHKWAADELSSKGILRRQDVYDMISKLIGTIT